MKSSEEASFLGCLLIVIMIPVGVLLKGFVLSKLWFWFMVPLGVMAISIAHGIGISILVSMFTIALGSSDSKKEDAAGMVFKSFGMLIAAPLLMWFFGWIAYCCM